MNPGFQKKLDKILNRFQALEKQLATLGKDFSPAELQSLSKEHAQLLPIVEAVQDLRKYQAQEKDIQDLLQDPSSDSEMRDLAYDELDVLKEKIPELEKKLTLFLLPKDAEDEKNAILEVRSGTGGEEAALFAADLFRMYQKYAESKKWRFEVIQANTTDLGGLKEGCASIAGKTVFACLKFESGVHRVQRVPQTEAGGRVHTSAATVAVLPEIEEVDFEIAEQDLRIDFFRASGPGGQSVNTTDSAVRITHIPTGIVVVQQEKSQHQNKARALKVLRARLYEFEKEKKAKERARTRKTQVGTGDRSERIRTYNFPQGRVTDHRINMTLYQIDQMMEGGIEPFVQALIAHDQAERLAHMNEEDTDND